jgi:acetyltransferase-like isoleucine patch superfamily enzyme
MSRNDILKPLLKLAGKGDMELDPAIPAGYIASTCWNYGTALVRGTLRGGGFESRSGRCFIDHDVTMRCKNMIRLSSNMRLRDGVYIDALSRDGVTLGDRALLGHNNRRIECTGSLSAIGKGISIGHDSTFGAECLFGAAGGIEIGNDVMAGQLVRFHSENHNFAKKDVLIREQGVTHQGIKIGDNVWIGAGTVFLDGANVGGGCVVAANAVVTAGDYPPNSVIVGIPARVVKQR